MRSGIELRDINSHGHGEDDDNHRDHQASGHLTENGRDSIASENSESMKDPHIWLNPRLVKIQAGNIFEALSSLDPSGRDYYIGNLEAFQKELDQLHLYIKKRVEGLSPRVMMVFHPSWGYFADEYGLTQIPVEVAGKEPGSRELAEIVRLARSHGIGKIFVQPQFSSAQAGAVSAATGAEVVTIDPLAENYLENMRSVADRIAGGNFEK